MALTAMREDVRNASGSPGDLPLERIEAELTELAGHLAAGECRWLLLVAEFDRRAGWEQWGCRSCVQWLSWQCGLGGRPAREKLRVAHALDSLPVITREFAAGRLSYSKVRALTRIATAGNDAELADLAMHATAVQVVNASDRARTIPPPCDARCISAIRDADSPDAGNGPSSTCTTFAIAPTVAATRSPTSSSSAGTTTASSTKAVGRSASTAAATSSRSILTVSHSPRSPARADRSTGSAATPAAAAPRWMRARPSRAGTAITSTSNM